MRTPGSDIELAQGFLLTEGRHRAPRRHPAPCGTARAPCRRRRRPPNTYNVLDVTLAPDVPTPDVDVTRNFYTTSSCGVCGKASLDAVRLISRHCPGDDPSTVGAETLSAMPDKLRDGAEGFRRAPAACTAPRCSRRRHRAGRTRRHRPPQRRRQGRSAGRWKQRPHPADRHRAARQRACVLRTHPEGCDGGDPGAGRGVGAVFARGRPRQPVRAHPGGFPAGRLDERLHAARPHHDR